MQNLKSQCQTDSEKAYVFQNKEVLKRKQNNVLELIENEVEEQKITQSVYEKAMQKIMYGSKRKTFRSVPSKLSQLSQLSQGLQAADSQKGPFLQYILFLPKSNTITSS